MLFSQKVSKYSNSAEDGSFTVDKTGYIELLKSSTAYNQLWRPKGFGKTFFCNMIGDYFDAAKTPAEVSLGKLYVSP